MFIKGDHKKFKATIKEDTVTRPKVSLLTPADVNHSPKGRPNAKLGMAADMPRKRKLNCVFLAQ